MIKIIIKGLSFLFICFIFSPSLKTFAKEIESPSAVVDKYFKALTRSDFETAEKYWEGAFPYKKNLQEQCDRVLVELMVKNTTWKINSSRKDGFVEVDVFEPDIAGFLKEKMDECMKEIVKSQAKMNDLADQLCVEMGKRIEKVTQKEIDAIGKKKSIRCYEVSIEKKIINQIDSPCNKQP